MNHHALLLALAAMSTASAPVAAPFPRGDGFRYPGDSGTAAMARYYRAWDARVASLPPTEPGRPAALADLAWMEGEWRTTARDFEADPRKGRGIVEIAHGTTHIAFTADQRWLRIESDLTDRYFARFIGWNRLSRRYVMQEISSPGLVYRAPVEAPPGHGGRVTFGPTRQTYYGLPLNDRITIVRQDDCAFRIVVEGRLADGGFMAVDDMVYARISAACGTRPG